MRWEGISGRPRQKGPVAGVSAVRRRCGGVAGPEAEAELMQLAAEVFRRLEIPIVLRWNNRGFLGELLGAMGLPAELSPSVMLTLDKLDKIGRKGFRKSSRIR